MGVLTSETVRGVVFVLRSPLCGALLFDWVIGRETKAGGNLRSRSPLHFPYLLRAWKQIHIPCGKDILVKSCEIVKPFLITTARPYGSDETLNRCGYVQKFVSQLQNINTKQKEHHHYNYHHTTITITTITIIEIIVIVELLAPKVLLEYLRPMITIHQSHTSIPSHPSNPHISLKTR